MTDIVRRGFLRALAAATCATVALMTTPERSMAEDYPSRPVRLVVGFPAGGPNDIQGRMIAQWLSARLGQPVNVENKPGASSNPATEEVARAPADGYTLLLVGPANAINPSIYQNLPFNFLRDIAPVASVMREPLVMLVHPSVDAKNVAEFIALAKANPGKLKMASTGRGSSPHVSGLLFTTLAGVDLDIVQYAGGGPALNGMIDGGAQVMFEPMSAAIEPVRSGKLRALAVTTTMRSAALPDLPSLSEAVPGYEASALTGLGVPAKTPPAIIERLNREINAAFSDPAMKQRIADGGGIILEGTPADFGRLLAAETEKWAKVIKSSGGKP
jgi:tripartite-type tricarboxylate transporter receptor subunit TctC